MKETFICKKCGQTGAIIFETDEFKCSWCNSRDVEILPISIQENADTAVSTNNSTKGISLC